MKSLAIIILARSVRETYSAANASGAGFLAISEATRPRQLHDSGCATGSPQAAPARRLAAEIERRE